MTYIKLLLEIRYLYNLYQVTCDDIRDLLEEQEIETTVDWRYDLCVYVLEQFNIYDKKS